MSKRSQIVNNDKILYDLINKTKYMHHQDIIPQLSIQTVSNLDTRPQRSFPRYIHLDKNPTAPSSSSSMTMPPSLCSTPAYSPSSA